MPSSVASKRRVFFDPWSLGDAVLAASCAEIMGQTLCCDERYVELLKEGALRRGAALAVLPVRLSYTSGKKRGAFGLGEQVPSYSDFDEVLTIRGDVRDWAAARRIFPRASVHASGFVQFVVRRLPPLEWTFRSVSLAVRNRYRAWAEISGLGADALERAYTARKESHRARLKSENVAPRIGMHLGAQYRSRQYPGVLEVAKLAQNFGVEVEFWAGPGDSLPNGVVEEQVKRLFGSELLDALARVQAVLVNDSGPMHLAAWMGVPAVVVARISNIEEWRPPGVVAVCSAQMPTGYKPDPNYWSDEPVQGWPEAALVAKELKAAC